MIPFYRSARSTSTYWMSFWMTAEVPDALDDRAVEVSVLDEIQDGRTADIDMVGQDDAVQVDASYPACWVFNEDGETFVKEMAFHEFFGKDGRPAVP